LGRKAFSDLAGSCSASRIDGSYRVIRDRLSVDRWFCARPTRLAKGVLDSCKRESREVYFHGCIGREVQRFIRKKTSGQPAGRIMSLATADRSGVTAGSVFEHPGIFTISSLE